MPSELRVDKVSSTTSPYDPVFSTTGGALSHRNLIINGDMRVAQRGATATDVNGTSGYFTVDRWKHWEETGGIYQTSQYSMSNADQNTTGHSKALKLNVKSGSADTSLGASEYAFVGTILEAQDLQHLQYGTANAKTITISFWVKSNKTGTYVLNLNKADSTVTRIPMEYTINTANTWEKKTITITPTQGSTSLITASGGAIANDNGMGFEIIWVLAVGSTYSGGTANTWSTNVNHIGTSNQVNWMDTDTNDFYLTGVQLELGSVATPFEHRSYGEELARCQRYFYSILNAGRSSASTGQYIAHGVYLGSAKMATFWYHPVPMRANPTLLSNSGGDIWNIYRADGSDTFNSLGSVITPTDAPHGNRISHVEVGSNVSGTGGHSGTVSSGNAAGYIQWNAEL